MFSSAELGKKLQKILQNKVGLKFGQYISPLCKAGPEGLILIIFGRLLPT